MIKTSAYRSGLRHGILSKSAQWMANPAFVTGSQYNSYAQANAGSGDKGTDLGFLNPFSTNNWKAAWNTSTNPKLWSDVGENLKRVGTRTADNLGSMGVRLFQGLGHLNPCLWFNADDRKIWNDVMNDQVRTIERGWGGFDSPYHDKSLEGGVNRAAVNIAGAATAGAVTSAAGGLKIIKGVSDIGVKTLPAALRYAGATANTVDKVQRVVKPIAATSTAAAWFPVADKAFGITEYDHDDSDFTKGIKDFTRNTVPYLAWAQPGSVALSRTAVQTAPVYSAFEAGTKSVMEGLYDKYRDDPAKLQAIRESLVEWWNEPTSLNLEKVVSLAPEVVDYIHLGKRVLGMGQAAQSVAAKDFDARRAYKSIGDGLVGAGSSIADTEAGRYISSLPPENRDVASQAYTGLKSSVLRAVGEYRSGRLNDQQMALTMDSIARYAGQAIAAGLLPPDIMGELGVALSK